MIPWALHCQAGGVLDPGANLKISDFTGNDGAKKALAAMGSSVVAPKKGKDKKEDKDKEPKEATELLCG